MLTMSSLHILTDRVVTRSLSTRPKPSPVKLRRLRKGTLLTLCTKAKATADAKVAPEVKSAKQYAVLHDFCMTIPYGAVVSVTGLVGLFCGQGGLAVATTLAGIVSCAASALSLKTWRSGSNNTRYTLASAGAALGAGAVSWRGIQNGGGWMGKLLLTLSAAIVVFLIYNVSAGGNPPKRVHN